MQVVVRSWRGHRFGIAAFVLWLSACGGGGGDGDGGDSGTPIADTAAAYWVSGTASTWSYQRIDRRSGADPTPRLKTVQDQGESTVDGRTVRKFQHSLSLFEDAPETEYRYFNGSDIRNVAVLGENTGATLEAQDYAEVPAPLVAGRAKTVVDRSEQVDVDGDGVADTVRIQMTSMLATEATLSVAAGDFRNLLQSREVITATVTLARTNERASASSSLTTWYAPGVGIVKRVYEDPKFSAPANTVTEELAGVSTGTLRAGLVPNRVALDGLGYGNDSGTPDGAAVAVGNGRFMAVSASQAGNIEGAIHEADGTLVWRGTVLSTDAPYRLTSAAVAFDGTDFRVVAVRTIPFNSPTEYALIAQRTAPGGTLRDGSGGVALEHGVVDPTQTLTAVRAAANDGQLLVAWGRYDTTYVTIGPGLVTQRGYVIEGRLFSAQQQPVGARFELDLGLPGSLAVRDDQYLIVNSGPNPSVPTLGTWAIGRDGVPVSTVAQPISTTALDKSGASLQTVGGELWASWLESTGSSPPMTSTLRVARLGHDGLLLDGTPAAPGQAVLTDDGTRTSGVLTIGASQSVLAWGEGWNSLQATTFDRSVLTGSAVLPSSRMALTPFDVATPGPSRKLSSGADLAGAFVVAWLDNEQSAATPSDRVMYSMMYPRYRAP